MHRSSLPLTVLALALAGCATAGPYTFAPDGPLPCERATCAVDLGAYRSVQERAGQDPDIVLAVTISGGGHRAGNFGVGALLGLEEIQRDGRTVLDEVDYFSTVSGGGFAAAAYLTSRLEHERRASGEAFRFARALREHCDARATERCLEQSLARSYEGLWVRHPGVIFSGVDAGDLLQREIDTRLLSAWSNRTGGVVGRRSLTLRDVFVPRDSARAPLVPYWVSNAALFRNGAVFSFTPDVLLRYQVSRYRHRLSRDTLRDPFDMPLSVGLKASVSVLGLIPITTLESRPARRFRYLRLLDGGVADNLGVITATDLLCQDSLRAAPTGRSRRLMLIVDAYQEDGMPYDPTSDSNVFGNLLRAAVIGLDSWHGRYAWMLSVFGARCGFEVVALSFESLDASGRSEWRGTPAERAACVAEIAPGMLEAGEGMELALRRLKRRTQAVRTRLRITVADQRALIAAGRLAACFARPAILAALAPPAP